MPKVLANAAIEQYRDQGYYFPLPVLAADEVSRIRARLEAFEAAQGHPVQGAQRSKSHLLFKWLDDLMRDARILDAVEDLIGPHILCWNSMDPEAVAFHEKAARAVREILFKGAERVRQTL